MLFSGPFSSFSHGKHWFFFTVFSILDICLRRCWSGHTKTQEKNMLKFRNTPQMNKLWRAFYLWEIAVCHLIFWSSQWPLLKCLMYNNKYTSWIWIAESWFTHHVIELTCGYGRYREQSVTVKITVKTESDITLFITFVLYYSNSLFLIHYLI